MTTLPAPVKQLLPAQTSTLQTVLSSTAPTLHQRQFLITALLETTHPTEGRPNFYLEKELRLLVDVVSALDVFGGPTTLKTLYAFAAAALDTADDHLHPFRITAELAELFYDLTQPSTSPLARSTLFGIQATLLNFLTTSASEQL